MAAPNRWVSVRVSLFRLGRNSHAVNELVGHMQAAPRTIAFLYRPPARFGAATIADLRDVARPQRQVAGLFVAEERGSHQLKTHLQQCELLSS
jgi:hypothetical protein